MGCIGCEKWKWNGERSTLGIDLMYGMCSKLGEETPHTKTCDAYKEKPPKAKVMSNLKGERR